MRAGSQRTPSEVGSQVGSVKSTSSAPTIFQPVALEKSKSPLDVHQEVYDAFRVGGQQGACSRGAPLWMRACKVCKDVAVFCPEEMRCRSLAILIEAHLLKEFPKREGNSMEKEMCDQVFRFVKEKAELEQHIRAQQVMATNLKATENRVLNYAKAHLLILQKLEFVQQKILESKTLDQVKGDAPIFLKGIKSDCAKTDVDDLIELFKMVSEFREAYIKAKQQLKEAAEKAQAEGRRAKADLHQDDDIIENFLNHHKQSRAIQGPRRAFIKAFLAMDVKTSLATNGAPLP